MGQLRGVGAGGMEGVGVDGVGVDGSGLGDGVGVDGSGLGEGVEGREPVDPFGIQRKMPSST